MGNIRLSIVFPLVGREKEFDKGFVSVMNQTLNESVEFIFVATVEGRDSLEFVKHWKKMYLPRELQIATMALPRRGEGMANARREGFLASKGDYVTFADPNKEVSPSYYADLLSCAIDNKSEVAMYNISEVMSLEDPASVVIEGLDKMPLEGKLFHRSLFESSKAHCPVSITEGEDYVLTAELMAYASEVLQVPQEPSIVGDVTSLNVSPEALSEVENYLRRHGLYQKYSRPLDRHKLRLKHKLMMTSPMSELSKYCSLFNEVEPAVLENTEIGFVWRLALTHARMGSSNLYKLFRLLKLKG